MVDIFYHQTELALENFAFSFDVVSLYPGHTLQKSANGGDSVLVTTKEKHNKCTQSASDLLHRALSPPHQCSTSRGLAGIIHLKSRSQ